MAIGKKVEEKLTPEEKLAKVLVPVEEQPYPVPGNWCWVKLEYLKKGVAGFFDGDWILSENLDVNGEVRLLQLSDIGIGVFLNKSNKRISNVTFEQLNCTELQEGDVMISRMAEPIARSCIVPQLPYKVITAVDVAVIRCNQKIVHNRFLNYLCNVKWFTTLALSFARGTTRIRITRKNLGELPIPIPPIPEQQRIVDCIKRLFAKLDEAKEKAQAVVGSFEIRKAAILHKAFTGELTVQWRSNNNISTDTWLQKKLSECTYAIGDGLHGTPLFSENEDYYFINGNNFSGEMIEIKQDTKSVDIHEFEKYRVPLSSDLTVFVSINGTLGKTAFYNGESIILGKSACYINASEELNKYYLRYYLWSKDFVDYANRMATGSTIKNLGLKAMRNLLIPLPSLDEQAEIVRILDDLLNKEQQAKASAESVLDQIDTMKKAILARAFRGKLGTNDPTEESSIELLKENVRSYFNE